MEQHLVTRFKNEYRVWCNHTSQNNQDYFSGLTNGIRPEESRLLADAQSVLDIGCGSGKRTFPAYQRMSLIHFGVDFQPQPDPLIRTFDITGDKPLNAKQFDDHTFDAIVFLGGALCGAIGYEEIRKAITNVLPILNPNGRIVADVILSTDAVHVYDPLKNTYLNRNLNDIHQNESNGVIFKLSQNAPPQYLFTRYELQRLADILNIGLSTNGIYNIPGSKNICQYYSFNKL